VGLPSLPRTLSRLTTRHGILLVDLKVQIPVVLTARVEPFPTFCTFTATVHIFLNAQHMLACSTKYRSLISLIPWPYTGLVGLASIVAADAGVKLLAAEMLDGDDVQWGMPVRALSQRRDR
jgi:hypothetical protein